MLHAWPADARVPTRRELDLYLMMLGAELKQHEVR